jgi:hypothetical protein
MIQDFSHAMVIQNRVIKGVVSVLKIESALESCQLLPRKLRITVLMQ